VDSLKIHGVQNHFIKSLSTCSLKGLGHHKPEYLN
jgi:hypothetical protein